MKSQKIIQYSEPLEEVEEKTPVPEGTEVLIKIIYSGVCHSDVHLSDGFFVLSGEKKMDISSRRSLPFTLGHEIFGEVVAFGKDAKNVKMGDRRAVYPWIGCGECQICLSGNENLCDIGNKSIGTNVDGGFSDYVIVPNSKYLIETDGVDERLAATYMCSGLTAYSALKKIGNLGRNDAVLILGLGGVGMSGLQLGKAVLKNPFFAADIHDTKLKRAQMLGAKGVYNTTDKEALSRLKSETKGGVSAVIDFVGSHKTAEFALGSLKRGGKYIVVGLYGGALSIPMATIPLRAISIVGSLTGSLSEAKDVMRLAKAGKIDPIPIEERSLDKAMATIADLKNGKIIGRVVLTPD